MTQKHYCPREVAHSLVRINNQNKATLLKSNEIKLPTVHIPHITKKPLNKDLELHQNRFSFFLKSL